MYDIQKDSGQTNNLASSKPEVMAKLKKQYDAWWDTLGPYQVNEGKEAIEKGNFPLQKRYQAQIQKGELPFWEPKPI